MVKTVNPKDRCPRCGKGSLVTDANTGEQLPGVNIILKGTYYGAATSIEGKFRIENIVAGNYIVAISLIGYKTVEYTDVKIEANKTKLLDVKLEETVLTLEQDVVIIGDKPLMDVEETQSIHTVSRDEIQVAVVEDIVGIDSDRFQIEPQLRGLEAPRVRAIP